jgi:hypothetical protein
MKNNEEIASAQEKVSLKKFFPLLQWLPTVSHRSMQADIIAGPTGSQLIKLYKIVKRLKIAKFWI